MQQQTMPTAVFILLVAIVSGIGIVLFLAGLDFWRMKRWNDKQPIISTSAQVLAKRMQVSGGGNNTSASTSYFATFETSDGERCELAVPGTDYGLLIKGDHGTLTSQGTRFKGFERQRIAQR